MKKFFIMLEEIWVAAAFAEAGEYNTLMSLNDSTSVPENPSLAQRKLLLTNRRQSC